MDVVYVAGTGRSGSTLLERLLGEVRGVAPVGEVIDLWTRGLAGNERCGCGELFRDCVFWSSVGDAAFGGWDRLDAAPIVASLRRETRHATPSWIAPRVCRAGSRAARAHLLDVLARLYRALVEVSGALMLVDTSKSAPYAALLREAGVDLRVIHLVRDARGVVHSMTKHITRPHAGSDRIDFMHRERPSRAALEWVVFNEAVHVLEWKGVPTMRLRYEDLAQSPAASLRAVLRFGGLDAATDDLEFLHGRQAGLTATHGLSGNPMRFRHGRVTVAPDESWRTEMPRVDRIVTTTVAAPLLAAYGYRAPRVASTRRLA